MKGSIIADTHDNNETIPCRNCAEITGKWLGFVHNVRIADLEAALAGLITAVDAADRASRGVFSLAAVHGVPYRGPTYKDAMDKARIVLGHDKNLQ